MHCGEHNGKLDTAHLCDTAEQVRHSVGCRFYGYGNYAYSSPPGSALRLGWPEAKLHGWRVVRVKVEKV